MLALIVDHSTASGVRLGEKPDPEPSANEALVRVAAISLNFGDIQDNVDAAEDGTVPGWEISGVVEKAAVDGTGPAEGTPVVSFGWAGGWAQLRAIDASTLGVVPESRDLGALSTVPVAGVSAFAALDRLGPLLGRRILVTGATGGVGRFAVQMARLGGAEVFAATSNPDAHADALRAIGADHVVDVKSLPADLDGVVDNVGGSILVTAFASLTRNGTLVSVGHVTDEPEAFPFGALLSRAGQDNRALRSFYMPEATDVAATTSWVARQIAAGKIDAGIGWRGSWRNADDAIAALRGRRLNGKAVLDVD